jgi:acyl-coenzyme A thioesterase PaaI-like protein
VTTEDDGTPVDAELMAATTDLGAALRELIEASVVTTAGAAEARAAAELVRAATARLTVSRRSKSRLPELDDPMSDRRVFSPVSGIGNALAPPLLIREQDGGVVAEATLGIAYEGPPSYLHGGMSALFMDQLLGSAAGAAGLWGMTVHLETDYRAPVPLETPLVFRAGVAESSGRKSVITGTIALAQAPDQALVEARGIFVMPRPEVVEAYFGSITDAAGTHMPPQRPSDAGALDRG